MNVNIAILWLLIVAFIGYLTFNTATSFHAYEKKNRERVLATARLVEHHASSNIDRANTALLEALDRLREDDFILGMGLPESRLQEIQDGLFARQKRTPGIVTIALIDKDGFVFVNSLGVARGARVVDRQYFIDLKSHPASLPVISEAVKGLVSGKWGILVTRRIDLSDGSFGGVIVANMGLTENFETFYDSVNLARDDAISLRDHQNRVLVRHPVLEASLAKVVAGSGSARQITLGQAESVVVSKSPLDGIERWTAIRKLPNYPVFAIVGVGRDQALAGWYQERLIAIMVALGSLMAGAVLTYGMLKRRQAESELRIAAVAFESQEGMMVTDAHSVILRVNNAFINTTGYSAEDAVGQTPSLLKSGRHDPSFYREMWETLSRTGGWQGEVWDRRKDGGIYPKWLTISAVKDRADRVTHYVGTHYDITERKKAEERIQELAFFDQLTDLPNRTLLLDRLKQAMTAGARNESYGALLFIDLDNFKMLNDTRGHDVGDLLLQQVAQRLTASVRAEDTVARLGGDEFVVVLGSLSLHEGDAASQTEVVGEIILEALNQPYLLGGSTHHSTPSIGATLFRGHRTGIDDLLKQADLAMYKAKAAGRNALRFFDPEMETVVMQQAALEADLRSAIDAGQFQLYYQAQVVGAGRVTGAEVLLRWQHPQRGRVLPSEFIPLAEATGLILPLGQWVLETACAQLAVWARQPEMAHLTIAVNVSAHQFREPDFVSKVITAVGQAGADANLLKLELTESLLVDQMEAVIEKMHALRIRGVGFSLDDFGTGYSSLSYLKRLPLDQLKIDQSFVREILTEPNDAAIAKTVVALAHSLGMGVIAEGVETGAQRDFLASAGCEAYQGYFFSRPLPLEDFEEFARR